MDYHPPVDKEIQLKTCVGVRNCWFNKWLYPKLYDRNSKTLTKYGLMVENFCKTYQMFDNVQKTYHGVIFESMNRYPINHYKWLGNYNTVKEYFDRIADDKIWDGYNLKYLQICTPKLSLDRILKGDPDEIKKLNEQIKFHVKLILLLDWILHQP